MTDGAAKTLVTMGNNALCSTARYRTSPAATRRRAWTSGQWMTERTGGSDVAISETVAQARVG